MKQVLSGLPIKHLIAWTSVVVLIFISIGFATKEQSDRQYNDVVFKITNQYDNYFVNERDLREAITSDGGQMIEGNKFSRLNLREIEDRLVSEMYVSQAQSYRDIKGNLVVMASQRRPIARIVRPSAPDAYIGDDGTVLPISDKFTSRVLLISGPFADTLANEENLTLKHQSYLELMDRIYKNKFLHAQIAQLDIDAEGKIVMYPQVTKQLIEFGTPTKMDLKFKKLDVFYKNILPKKGWNHYSRVNLTYSNQIICE